MGKPRRRVESWVPHEQDAVTAGAGGGPRRLPEGRLLTVAEVAAMMRVSRMTVYRLVHDGAIASVKVGRSYRVPEAAAHDYLDKAYTEAG